MATSKKAKPKADSLNDGYKKNCFIIMPFGGWFDNYFESIYIPAIEDADLVPKRADDLYRPGNIVNDIWTYTKDADVVLADLTNKNPNVFYELGLAHAITKPAVLITASMEDVPFDLRSLRVIVYDKNSPDWGEILKQKITKALIETLKNPEDAIPPTFLEVTRTKKVEVTDQEKGILELKSEVDSLRRELRSSIIRHPVREERIDSAEAERRIQYYLRRGLEPDEIATRLRPLGPPIDWTMNKIKEIRENPESG